jgi:hypothetical protein
MGYVVHRQVLKSNLKFIANQSDIHELFHSLFHRSPSKLLCFALVEKEALEAFLVSDVSCGVEITCWQMFETNLSNQGRSSLYPKFMAQGRRFFCDAQYTKENIGP